MTCEIKGPYYPVSDVDWMCRTHEVPVLLVDPARWGAGNLKAVDFRCPMEDK